MKRPPRRAACLLLRLCSLLVLLLATCRAKEGPQNVLSKTQNKKALRAGQPVTADKTGSTASADGSSGNSGSSSAATATSGSRGASFIAASARGLAQLHAADGFGQEQTQPGRAVLLYTQFGSIRIRLLERLAPRITALVWGLAARRGCIGSYNCAFYRNEAIPQPSKGQNPLGPPYALLQGRMYDLPEDPPYEGIIPVKRGHVCFIPGGKDFFIALGDHPEWGTSHPVWGVVEEWFTVDLITSQQYNNWSNPTEPNPVVLRILKIEVPWKIAVEGDTTFVGPLP